MAETGCLGPSSQEGAGGFMAMGRLVKNAHMRECVKGNIKAPRLQKQTRTGGGGKNTYIFFGGGKCS